MRLDFSFIPQKKIDNINVVFSKTEDELDLFLEACGIPPTYFKSIVSYAQVLECLRLRKIDAHADYLPVWFLMEMEHEERNKFLRQTGRTTIEDEKSVRNVAQLIEYTRQHWPNVMQTMGAFTMPELGYIHITYLLAMPQDELEQMMKDYGWSIDSFCSLDSTGALFAWLDNKRTSYTLINVQIWTLLSMNSDDKELVKERFKRNAKNSAKLNMKASDDQLFHYGGEDIAANISAYRDWFLKVLRDVDIKSTDNVLLPQVIDLLEYTIEEVRLGSDFKRIQRWLPPRYSLGDLNILLMVDTDKREEILAHIGLKLSDIESLRSSLELRWVLAMDAQVESRYIEVFQNPWKVFDAKVGERAVPRSWSTHGSLSMRTITTVGDFLEWMYLSLEDIECQLHQRAVYNGPIKKSLELKEKCIADQNAICGLRENIDRIEKDICNKKKDETKRARKSRKAQKRRERKNTGSCIDDDAACSAPIADPDAASSCPAAATDAPKGAAAVTSRDATNIAGNQVEAGEHNIGKEQLHNQNM